MTSAALMPGYLREPDYYRLGYQELAIEANAAAEHRISGRLGPDDQEIPLELTHAVQTADELLGETTRILEWFADRDLRPGLRDGLDNQERRLQTFLAGTVAPCLATIRAGLRIEWEPPVRNELPPVFHRLPGPRTAIRRRGIARMPDVLVIRWSYRALYNLACLASVRAAHAEKPDVLPIFELCDRTGLPRGRRTQEHEDVAFWAYQQALSLATGHARAALLTQARTDPTIVLLRTRLPERMDALEATFRLPERPAPPAEPVHGPEGLRLLRGLLGTDKRLDLLKAVEVDGFLVARQARAWDDQFAAQVLRTGMVRKLRATVAGREFSLTRNAWLILAEELLEEATGPPDEAH